MKIKKPSDSASLTFPPGAMHGGMPIPRLRENLSTVEVAGANSRRYSQKRRDKAARLTELFPGHDK